MKEANLPSYSQWYSLASSDIEKFGIYIWEEKKWRREEDKDLSLVLIQIDCIATKR